MKKIIIVLVLIVLTFSCCNNSPKRASVENPTESTVYSDSSNTTIKTTATTNKSTVVNDTKTHGDYFKQNNNNSTVFNKNNVNYRLIDVSSKIPVSSENYDEKYLDYLKLYYHSKFISKDYTTKIKKPVLYDDIWSSKKYKKGHKSKEYPDFYIDNTDNGVIITKYTGNSKTVELPETIDGKKVVEIGHAILSTSVEKLIISQNIRCISQSAFEFDTLEGYSDCKLKDIVVDSKNSVFANKDGVLFTKDYKYLLYIPPCHCKSYSIPEGTVGAFSIQTIGSKMSDIFIPSSLIELDLDSIFDMNVNISKNHKLMCSIDGNIYSKDGTVLYRITNTSGGKYKMPDDVKYCSIGAFPTEIKELYLNKNLQQINISELCECDITKINVDKKNKILKSVDGVLYDKSGKTLLWYPQEKIPKSKVFKVPDTVCTIMRESINSFPTKVKLSLTKNVDTIYVSLPSYKDGSFDFASDIIGYPNTIAESLADFCGTKFLTN